MLRVLVNTVTVTAVVTVLLPATALAAAPAPVAAPASTDSESARVEAACRDPLARLVDGVVTAVRALRDNELLARITDVDPELLLPYLLDRRGRSQELVIDLLTEEIRQAQRAGAVRRGNAGLLARSVVLAAHGFTLSAHTMLDGEQRRGADVRRFDRELAAMVRRYLTP